MRKEKKVLDVAEQEIVNQMRRWPTLYPNSMSVFLGCIVSSCGSYQWESDGTLKNHDPMLYWNGKSKPWPFKISEEVAADLLNSTPLFYSVHNNSDSPISRMPDNMHKDWIKYIGFMLYMCERITPELYKDTLISHCIMHYGKRENEYAGYGNYQLEWEKFYERIPSYKASLRLIEKIQTDGNSP